MDTKTNIGQNRLDNETEGSFIYSHHHGHYHFNRLNVYSGTTNIDNIRIFYTPFLTNWDAGYTQWHNAHTYKMGTTALLDSHRETLIKTKAAEFVDGIHAFYHRGSAEAKSYIPHERKAFISGTDLEKITAIKDLISAISADTNLAAVASNATAFLNIIEPAYNNHITATGKEKDLSEKQEILRKELTAAMFADQGMLMKEFMYTPKKVELFFDVNTMSRRQGKKKDDDTVDTTLSPSEIALMDVRFSGKETLIVTNNSKGDAAFFFSETSTVTSIPTDRVLIHPGETVEIDLKTISTDKRFLFGANLSAVDDAELSSKLK